MIPGLYRSARILRYLHPEVFEEVRRFAAEYIEAADRYLERVDSGFFLAQSFRHGTPPEALADRYWEEHVEPKMYSLYTAFDYLRELQANVVKNISLLSGAPAEY